MLSTPAASAAVVYQPGSGSSATSQASPVDLGGQAPSLESLGRVGPHIVVDRPEVPPSSPAPEAPEWALLLAGAGLGLTLFGARFVRAKRSTPAL
jgi:hypothetical protein